MWWRFIGIFLLLSCGCAPVVYTTVPRISGRVVDRAGSPVPAASVVVTDALDPQSPFQLDLVSRRPDGRFSRAADTSWGVFIVGMDNFGRQFKAKAVADDSMSEPKRFGREWSQVRLFGLGSVDAIDLGDLVLTQRVGGR